jgi:glycosyltransferase involved in cell wall biosynthesis
VVISQGFNNDGMAWMHACSSLKIPYVVIVQAASSTGWQKDLIAFKLADLYQKADKVFFVSRNNQKLTEEQIGTNLSNAEIIWNPCGIKRVQEIAWPITPNIAVVGRLDPDAKGCDLVLHAVNQVEWGDTKPTITFYGEGSCRQLLTRLRDKLNIPNVQFAGARTLPDIWSNNQLLLLPSRYEGLPLAVIEAMLCGRPCLVTRFSGGDEVLTHEKTGFICEAPTSPLLQDTLQKAWDLRAEWPKMGQAALQHIRQIYPTDPANTFVERIKAAFIKT